MPLKASIAFVCFVLLIASLHGASAAPSEQPAVYDCRAHCGFMHPNKKHVPNNAYYFLHLHKASGTSVIKELQHRTTVQYVVSCEVCARVMLRNSTVFPVTPRLFTFVRHPLDRVVSEFNYNIAVREMLEHIKVTEAAKAHEFSIFAQSKGGYAKYKVSRPGDIHFFNRLTNDLPAPLRTFWFVGASEFFESSMCILLYKMGIPEPKCACADRNQLSFRHEDHHVSHSISPSTISPDLKMSIMNSTQPDMKLYVEGLSLLFKTANHLRHSTGADFLCEDREKLKSMLEGFAR